MPALMPERLSFHRLSAALLIALACPVAASAQSSATDSETKKAEAKTLDGVSVTGSRIKRTDIETQLPITVMKK